MFRNPSVPPKTDPQLLIVFAVLSIILAPGTANADGSVVDKVYHPYVDALENEIEYRSIFQDENEDGSNAEEEHQLAYGRSLGDSFFVEAYLVGEKSRNGSFELEAYELELKWQLTEQGEYTFDWGVLFEYEHEINEDVQEFAVGLLVEKEFGRWSAAGNLFLIREWGDDINDEFETAFSAQARYRYSKALEPALEVYIGQGYLGVGPALLGSFGLNGRKSLNWEAGIIFGTDSESPDKTFRLLFELEF